MHTIFLQAAQGGQFQIFFMLALFAILYFFFFRPQMKKQKEQGNFMNDLAKGDEVCLASGIIGRINKIEGNIVHLQIDQKTFIRVTKNAVSKEMTESVAKGELPEESK